MIEVESFIQWFSVATSLAAAIGGYIKLRERLIVIETKLNIYFKDVAIANANFLHSPHTPNLDVLLEKVSDGKELNKNEILEMLSYLRMIIKDPMETERRKSSAETLIAVTKAKYHLT